MTVTHEQIASESLRSLHNKSSTNNNCSLQSLEQSKSSSNDTGCETDFKNAIESSPNTSASTCSGGGSGGRNLIINYLPQHMTELEIHKLFSLYGNVESCKLIRNKDLKQSLGYAFVKYYNQESAKKAIEELNGLNIHNKKIKVSVARPSRPEIKDANLYVGGLPANCTETQLRQLFGEYGDIISCRVIRPSQKTADYHFGFVRFDTNQDAQCAMEALHGKVPPRSIFPDVIGPITVKFARAPNAPETLSQNQPLPFANCEALVNLLNYNQRISNSTTSFGLPPQSLFNSVPSLIGTHHVSSKVEGAVEAPLQVNVDENTNTNPYCGRSHTNYFNSLKNINSAKVDNSTGVSANTFHPLTTSSHKGGQNQQQRYFLVLINLPMEYTELNIYKLCSKFGSINEVKVFLEDQICFCTVEMNTKAEVDAAASNLNGLVLSQYQPISAIVF